MRSPSTCAGPRPRRRGRPRPAASSGAACPDCPPGADPGPGAEGPDDSGPRAPVTMRLPDIGSFDEWPRRRGRLPMKIVVLVKHVPEPTAAWRFSTDLTLDRAGVEGRLSQLDEYAIEQCVRLAEAG